MVTVRHTRAVNFCARGARQWFTRYGLDWNEFITKGLPISVIENTDALGKTVAEAARLDAAGELE